VSTDNDDAFFAAFLDDLDRTDPEPSGIPHRELHAAASSPQEVRIKLGAIRMIAQVEAYLAQRNG
jgi:hypothetical protein